MENVEVESKLVQVEEIFKDPIDLLLRLESIRYAGWDDLTETPIHNDDPRWDDTEYIMKNLRVLHPSEVWEKKIGTCWECSLAAIGTYFGDDGYRAKMYYVDANYPGSLFKEFHTHLGVTVYWGKRFWWLEHSWYIYKGLHGPYNTREDVYEKIKDLYRFHFGDNIFFNPDVDYVRLLALDKIRCADVVNIGRTLKDRRF